MPIYTNKEWLESDEFPFYAAAYPFYKQEMIPPHSHEFVEFVYVVEGKGQHKYNGHAYPIAAGDVFIIEPHVEHAYKAGDDPPLIVYNVIFQPDLLLAELETLSKFTSFIDFFYLEPFLRQYVDFQSRLTLEQHEHIEIVSHLERLVKEFKGKEMGYRVLIKTRLIELFIFLSRCYARRIHKSMSAISSEEEVILHICEFIKLHHTRPLTLTQVSQLCGMSHSAFSAKFKQQIGQTFVEFRNQIRIKVAQDLLLKTNDKIISIALQVGFDDLSFFSKMFKQQVGLPPRQFREQNAVEPRG